MKLKSLVIGIVLTVITNTVFALPAPKYLSVPNWKSCTRSVSNGSASYVCLPQKRPGSCPRTSWRTLRGQQLIMMCPSYPACKPR